MDDLSEQLIDHMDTFGERTVQGAFCSVINWGLQAVERLGPDHRNEVIGCCGRWWLKHEPEGCEVVSRAWLHLGECIVDLIQTAKTNGGGK
jgi:hypothetical protein